MDPTTTALRAAGRLARVAPHRVAQDMGRVLARAIAASSADERMIVARNLRRARGRFPLDGPVPKAQVREVFDSYGRYWVDTVRLPHLSDAEVEAGFIRDPSMQHLDDAVAAGTAPILALPHLGGWEWAARWLDVRGHKVAAVVEEIEPPEMYEWFLDLRRSLGMHIIPLGPSSSSEVAAALAAGEIVCLLCDRDISGSGIEVEFFGERTRLPGGPALLALRTGAPLLPSAVYFEGERCLAMVEEPLDTTRRGRLRDDVARVTQDLARVLERQVRRAPEQWHLLQPNWPSDYATLGRPQPPAG